MSDSHSLLSETTLGLAEAARSLPSGRKGRQPHLSTLLRWVLNGVRGPGGERVRLEGLRLGSRWITSKEALQRFAERLTPRLDGAAPATPVRTPANRLRSSEKAAEQLEKIGV